MTKYLYLIFGKNVNFQLITYEIPCWYLAVSWKPPANTNTKTQSWKLIEARDRDIIVKSAAQATAVCWPLKRCNGWDMKT